MISAIILAGGKGKRMGSDISKQYIEIKGKPILYYTLKKFTENKSIDKVILVLPQDEIDYCKREVLEKYSLKVDKLVVGGKERQDSVYNGLQSLEKCNIVLIHDGARPFVTDKIIEEGIEFAKEYGAAAPGVMPKDTIKVKDIRNFAISTPDRSSLVAIQTPQVFNYNKIFKCHQFIKDNNISVTDDTMVVEQCGEKVYIYDGDYSNVKITTVEDLYFAERFIK